MICDDENWCHVCWIHLVTSVHSFLLVFVGAIAFAVVVVAISCDIWLHDFVKGTIRLASIQKYFFLFHSKTFKCEITIRRIKILDKICICGSHNYEIRATNQSMYRIWIVLRINQQKRQEKKNSSNDSYYYIVACTKTLIKV